MADPVRRVAVTGAAGYVAGGLIRRLEREDAIERILAMDIRPLGTTHSPKVVFLRHDVTQPMAKALSEHGIDTVAHLAFVLNPGHKRAAARRVNVGGAAGVLGACAESGVRHILYLSSTTVFGAHADNPPLLTEESPARPVKGFQYGEDKAAVEALLADFAAQNPVDTVAVLRACPVMGPSTDNFISRAFSKPFQIGVRGSDPPMQLIHEDDLAKIMCRCLLRRVSGTYNVAGEGAVPWSEMAAMFGRRLIRLPAPLVYGLTGATWKLRLQSDSPACGLDFIRYRWNVSTEKIRRELDFSPRYSSRDAWEAVVAREREPVGEKGRDK